ncbi:MAG: chain-length determining protein [Planktotalea sp.]|uniref:GumC family protein n=1 Tax=Planktotalea sp. TaxID=2029877 RepID=UPI003C742457
MDQIRTVGEFFGVIKRRFFLMALIVCLGTLAAIYYALNQPSLYETHAALQIESASVANQTSGATSLSNGAAHRLTLIEQRLMARDSLVRVIEKLELFSDGFGMPLNEKVDALRSSVQIAQNKDGAQSWQPNITPSGLLISVRFGDPELAARIANEFLGSVLEENRKRKEERSKGALAFFTSEEERIGADILVIEEEIAAFKSANSDALPSGILSQRDQLGTLRETELEIEREIIAASSNTNRQRQSVVDLQVTRLEEQKALIQQRINRIDAVIAAAPEIERELGALSRRLRQLQDQYSVITTGRAEAEMGQLLETADQSERFVVLETALVPEYAVSPSRKKIAMLGFIGSGFLACLAALALEMMNPAIRTSAQLERQLGLQPVVSIPYVSSTWEQRRRKLTWIAGFVALILSLPFILRTLAEKGLGGMLGGLFKREANS